MQGALDIGLNLLGRLQGLTCPVYCGSSLLPAFVAGLSTGLLIGAAFTAWILIRPTLPETYIRPPSSSPVVRARHTNASSRLSGYLHD